MSENENKSKKLKSSNDKNKADQINSAAACSEHKLLCGSSVASENEESAPAVINSNSPSLSVEEMVFSIPHLLEFIFSGCDRSSLLKCRLVSNRWAYCGSKALQGIVNIKLVMSYKEKERPKLVLKGSNQELPIEDLIALMNNSTEFPCTSFYLDFGILNNCKFLARAFFMAHGTLIKKLRIDGCLFLDEFKDILLTQVPNLEQLLLMKWFGIHYVYEDLTSELFNEQARLNAPLFDESLPGPRRPILKKLRVFQCHNAISKIFVQQMIEVSPNLAEVDCSMEYFECLVNPVNRFHLLKKVELGVGERDMESLEVAASQNNWTITELVFDFYQDNYDEALHLRAVDAVNKILKGCSATCKRLEWYGYLPNFEIPKMPQVMHMRFQCDEDDDGLSVSNFPEGVSLKDTFPNLKTIEIGSYYEIENLSIQDLFGNKDPAPVLTVQNVDLGLIPEENLLFRLREMFPNATIRTDVRFDHVLDD